MQKSDTVKGNTDDTEWMYDATDQQLIDYVRECDTALIILQKTIDSPDSNSEERFDARRGFNAILKTKEKCVKVLEKRRIKNR